MTAEDIMDMIRSKAKYEGEGHSDWKIKWQQDQKIIQFKDNPLAVLMAFTELSSTLEHTSYESVFVDDDETQQYNTGMEDFVLDENLSEIKQKAERIIEFYQNALVSKRLSNSEHVLSSWEQDLSVSLTQMRDNKLQFKFLRLMVSLPKFYNFSMLLASHNRSSKSQKLIELKRYVRQQHLLKFIDVVQNPKRSSQKKLTVLFENQDGVLCTLEVANCESSITAMKKVFEKPTKLVADCWVNYDYGNSMGHFIMDNIEFV